MKKKLLSLIVVFSVIFNALAQAPTHEGFSKLLKKNVSANGKVNYQGFKKDSAEFNNYLELLTKNPPQKSWSRNEQMAYWINAYNAFTIKLITKYYPLKSIKEIGSSIQIPFVNTPWDIKFISIGKDKLDLNNIEHGILRKKFADPRIHMTLVCASKSCPALLNEAYEATKLEDQLSERSKAFLTDPSRNKISSDQPQLSMIFKWYAMDFNDDGKTVIDFVNRYSPVKVKATATVQYLDYDWNLND
ncbi:DUF547 domain-containing protein [Chryseolinea sp. H1M3-3]|uniref:DUF547 domain-containing protein n=1 Tax=Chryseolinea sp. H1M3-3 TaxID=3034144 RepID=UPI0023ED90BE|nr:DUF547 domain-containing protein [Chryseolinea sp. H1M3-3]